MTCRWVLCGRPIPAGFWCPEHAARAAGTTTLDAEPTSEDH